MALFAIDRYVGDVVEENENLKISTEDKIKELKNKAKSRKKHKIKKTKLPIANSDTEKITTISSPPEKKKKVSAKQVKKSQTQTDESPNLQSNDNICTQAKAKLAENASEKNSQAISVFDKNYTSAEHFKAALINEPSKSIHIERLSDVDTNEKDKDIHSSENDNNPTKHFKSSPNKDTPKEVNVIKPSSENTQNMVTKAENNCDIKIDKGVRIFGSDYNPTEHFKAALKKEVGGFTILGDYVTPDTRKVARKLPDWLANPSIIEDISSISENIDDTIKGIDPILIDNLSKMGITGLFPVQQQLIPVILRDTKLGIGPCVFPPNDICVSAPTGSGKTIAFALPIVQSLLQRVVPTTRALAVLPTRELAAQVYQVFMELCEKTSLRCVLLSGTSGTPEQEEKTLVKFGRTGLPSLPDIVVATPGRLVCHLKQCTHFVLDQLRFLVIDEADRMMDQIKNDWLSIVEQAAYVGRSKMQKLTVNTLSHPTTPLQKLLFSATLSADPEKLEQLNLFQPRLYTALSNPSSNDLLSAESSKLVGKYTTPVGLSEFMLVCSPGEKPLVVLHLALKHNRVLCFAGAIQTAHRLAILLQLYADKAGLSEKFVSAEFSSQLSMGKRNVILKKFRAGKINILVASDAMARGMDIKGVSIVILYDAPCLIKTYIHRVGRTARAGEKGTAYTILRPQEVFPFKAMLNSAGKSIKRKKIWDSDLKKLEPIYEEVLPLVAEKLKEKR